MVEPTRAVYYYTQPGHSNTFQSIYVTPNLILRSPSGEEVRDPSCRGSTCRHGLTRYVRWDRLQLRNLGFRLKAKGSQSITLIVWMEI